MASGHEGVSRTRFAIHLKQPRNWTKHLKQLFLDTGQQAYRTVAPKRGKQTGWVLQLSQVTAQRISQLQCREEALKQSSRVPLN